MASVSKSVLVEHSAQRMFDLVERAEDYPQFLPWCGGTAILERTATAAIVRIEINFHGVKAHFTTNRNEPPSASSL
jgi:ribosome-associated toxin RatA of RatAB toxin-antitoxin module